MLNILIVEDDSKQRENFVKMIHEADKNLNVYEAESKHEAIKILEETFIDLFYIEKFLRFRTGF